MVKAKNNLNTLLDPLPANKNEEIIQELIDDNPLLKNSGLIERNSALINRRVAPSPRSVVLKSLNSAKPLPNKYSGKLKTAQGNK